MRRNSLITGLVILLGVVLLARAAVQFGFPSFLNAQNASGDAVGTHAAFFDVGGNLKIANLVKGKGGNKITVMVDINATRTEINSILSATDGLTKIIRIVGVNSQAANDGSKAEHIADELNNSNISSGTIVVFGNEVNNLNKEWQCGGCSTPGAATQYGDFFKVFSSKANRSKYNPVPAPLDMYNGDFPDFATFISVSGVYGGDVVANVYDVGSTKLDSYKQYPGRVIAFTEYGPDPAKSLQEHINFYKSHTPPVLATTLVPDKCNPGTDKFLYYINGKIYDAEGNEVDPVTCDKSTSSSTGHTGLPPDGEYYKRFVYPFYRTSPEEGVPPLELMTTILENDYSMTCSNPANLSTQAIGSVKELIDYQGECRSKYGDACLFQPDASLSVTSDGLNKLFGVLRNENEVKWRAFDYTKAAEEERMFTNRFESVEQWFGANNPKEGISFGDDKGEPVEYANQTPDEINGTHQGPYYKLTTLYGQCLAEREVLIATYNVCERWQSMPENMNGPGLECSLFAKKVPGTPYDYRDLRDKMADYERLKLPNGPDICTQVFNNEEDRDDDKEMYQPTEEEKEIVRAMSNVDLYQETAYRPAFLVMSTEVDSPTTPAIGPGNPTQQVKPKSSTGTIGRHQVDFLVYHVPDTITDMDPKGDYSYDDIITRTAKTFTPLETTEKAEKDWETNNRAKIEAMMDAPSAAPEIDCHGGDCDTNLKRALIDFINAYSAAQKSPGFLGSTEECKTPVTENAESGSRIGNQLAPVGMNQTDINLWSSSKQGPIGTAKSEVEIQEYRNDGGIVSPKSAPPQVRIYNITPHGFRTKYVADAFDAFFAKAQLSGQFRDNDKYLSTFESIFGSSFDTEPDIAGYTRPSGGVDEFGNPLYEGKEVKDDVTLSPNPFPVTARVPWLARVFNFSTRGMVQQISHAGENLLECARAVTDPKKNTEDFLLHCQSRGSAVGAISNTSVGTSTIPNATCEIKGGFPITSPELGDLLVDAAHKYNLPVQVLMAVLYVENCRSGATICNKSGLDLTAHVPYGGTAGCPGQNRVEGTGVFQFNLTYWPAYKEDAANNACSIRDSFYDAARWLNSNYNSNGSPGAIGTAPAASQWSEADMKRVLTRWAANSDTCSGHPFAKYYCDLMDQFLGHGTSSTEPPIQKATAIQTTCN